MKKKLYTAVGRFESRTDHSGHSCPVIHLGSREYLADLQEMAVWASLNWRIARPDEMETYYKPYISGLEHSTSRSFPDCVDRLLLRRLLVCGSGQTEYDALYDLLSSLYVLPVGGSLPLRLASFLKLTLFYHIPITTAGRQLFSTDKRSLCEQKVMCLAKQALLSAAEIIKCVEKGIRSLPDEESILDGLYDDNETTSENIPYLMKFSPCSRPVIAAIANLYLRRQILFEKI